MIDGYMFYGIVNVITRSADFSSVDLPLNALRMKYRISGPAASFISPDYSSTERKRSRIPDLRNTMYWNPALKPSKDGKVTVEFWTSDFATDYIINVRGITGNGDVISFTKPFRMEQRRRP
jgi:hypothetical protein